jgi:hypothetical protein
MQTYFDESRREDRYALSDCEVFYHDGSADMVNEDGESLPAGWYWWACFPGCLPDGAPSGPFDSAEDAEADAQDFT